MKILEGRGLGSLPMGERTPPPRPPEAALARPRIMMAPELLHDVIKAVAFALGKLLSRQVGKARLSVFLLDRIGPTKDMRDIREKGAPLDGLIRYSYTPSAKAA
jgi:hypothetical protein